MLFVRSECNLKQPQEMSAKWKFFRVLRRGWYPIANSYSCSKRLAKQNRGQTTALMLIFSCVLHVFFTGMNRKRNRLLPALMSSSYLATVSGMGFDLTWLIHESHENMSLVITLINSEILDTGNISGQVSIQGPLICLFCSFHTELS